MRRVYLNPISSNFLVHEIWCGCVVVVNSYYAQSEYYTPEKTVHRTPVYKVSIFNQWYTQIQEKVR